jgi:hypothetical protein
LIFDILYPFQGFRFRESRLILRVPSFFDIQHSLSIFEIFPISPVQRIIEFKLKRSCSHFLRYSTFIIDIRYSYPASPVQRIIYSSVNPRVPFLRYSTFIIANSIFFPISPSKVQRFKLKLSCSLFLDIQHSLSIFDILPISSPVQRFTYSKLKLSCSLFLRYSTFIIDIRYSFPFHRPKVHIFKLNFRVPSFFDNSTFIIDIRYTFPFHRSNRFIYSSINLRCPFFLRYSTFIIDIRYSLPYHRSKVHVFKLNPSCPSFFDIQHSLSIFDILSRFTGPKVHIFKQQPSLSLLSSIFNIHYRYSIFFPVSPVQRFIYSSLNFRVPPFFDIQHSLSIFDILSQFHRSNCSEIQAATFSVAHLLSTSIFNHLIKSVA